MPVSQEHALGVGDFFLRVFRVITVVDGAVIPAAFERNGKLARGAEVAKQELSKSRPTLLARIPSLEQRGHTVEPCIHVNRSSGSYHPHCVLVRRGHFPDQFILCGGKLKGTIAAFALTFLVKSNRDDHGVGARGQHLCRCANHFFWADNAELHARPAPTVVNEVLETHSVRARVERYPDLTDSGFDQFPVINHEVVIQVEPVAALLSGSLHKEYMLARVRGGEVSGPTRRDFILVYTVAERVINVDVLVDPAYSRLPAQTRVVIDPRIQAGMLALGITREGSGIGHLAEGWKSTLVVDGDVVAEICGEAFEVADGGKGTNAGTASSDDLSRIGVRADDGDGLDLCLIERQQVPVVLEQHHA